MRVTPSEAPDGRGHPDYWSEGLASELLRHTLQAAFLCYLGGCFALTLPAWIAGGVAVFALYHALAGLFTATSASPADERRTERLFQNSIAWRRKWLVRDVPPVPPIQAPAAAQIEQRVAQIEKLFQASVGWRKNWQTVPGSPNQPDLPLA